MRDILNKKHKKKLLKPNGDLMSQICTILIRIRA